jgi:hypothetical protein
MRDVVTKRGTDALGDHIIVGSVFPYGVSKRRHQALEPVGDVATGHAGRTGGSVAQVRTGIACTGTAARTVNRVEEVHEAGA